MHGSKPQVEVASARRKLSDHDSTLPRLLTAVYTPLLRCATASDACNLVGGLRTKQTGSCCHVPRFAYQATLPFCPNLFQLNHKILARWFTAVRCRRLAGRFSLCFGTFLSSRCPSFLHQVRQPLSTRRREIVPLFLGASHSIGNSSHPCGGLWCLAVQCCYGSTKSVSLPLQFRYDSPRIQGALLERSGFAIAGFCLRKSRRVRPVLKGSTRCRVSNLRSGLARMYWEYFR